VNFRSPPASLKHELLRPDRCVLAYVRILQEIFSRTNEVCVCILMCSDSVGCKSTKGSAAGHNPHRSMRLLYDSRHWGICRRLWEMSLDVWNTSGLLGWSAWHHVGKHAHAHGTRAAAPFMIWPYGAEAFFEKLICGHGVDKLQVFLSNSGVQFSRY
jgi:hypothetical protein